MVIVFEPSFQVIVLSFMSTVFAIYLLTCACFVQGSSGNLYIRGVQFHHEGEYSCDVITAMNSDSRSAYLNVKGVKGKAFLLFFKFHLYFL